MARKQPTKRIDGFLLVDKPEGVSSHDVVNMVRRATGEKQVGHAGTLDPFATGLLVILLGRSTRLAQYVRDEPKVYEATVRFGTETDTEDLGGTVVREAQRPTRAALLDAAPRLTGQIEQVPPAFSAKRVGGKRAYEAAREGLAVELKPVTVTVHGIALGDFSEEGGRVSSCTMRVECGGGTYVRSLARDLARAAGSAAHLTALRRIRCGEFDLTHSVPVAPRGSVTNEFRVAPVLGALAGYPVQDVSGDEAAKLARGIDIEARVDGDYAALVDPAVADPATALVAFGARRPSERGVRWQPRVVFRDP